MVQIRSKFRLKSMDLIIGYAHSAVVPHDGANVGPDQYRAREGIESSRLARPATSM